MLALREVVLGRWAVVGPQARQATLQFLLHTALAQLAADPRRLLRTQVGCGGGGCAPSLDGQRARWRGTVALAGLEASCSGKVAPSAMPGHSTPWNAGKFVFFRLLYPPAGACHGSRHHQARLAGHVP